VGREGGGGGKVSTDCAMKNIKKENLNRSENDLIETM
jgi:hypothetical protein